MTTTDTLSPIIALIERVRQTATSAANARVQGTDGAARKEFARYAPAVFTAWDKLQADTDEAIKTLPTIGDPQVYSVDENHRRIRDFLTATRDTLEADVATAQTAVEALGEHLRPLATPEAPATDDPVLREAQLAALKTDLRMILDRLPADDVRRRMQDQLRTWQATPTNDLGVALLTSDWPALYLESRGVDPILYTGELPNVLNLTHDQAEAVRLLELTDGPRGLGGAVIGMRTWARMTIDSLASSRGVTLT